MARLPSDAFEALAQTLARICALRVIADPCQRPGEQVERVVGQACHLAEDGSLQARPVGHARRRSRM
jgi:hypothetical protein